jgi:hypothetical protein
MEWKLGASAQYCTHLDKLFARNLMNICSEIYYEPELLVR